MVLGKDEIMLYHKISKTITKNIYVLIVLFLSAGCGNKLMFTYSDHSYENYLEDQRHNTPWQSDSAQLQLENTAVNKEEFKTTITSKAKKIIDGSTIVMENGETVKYVGIETIQPGDHFYEKSIEFNKSIVEGKTLRLRFDRQGRDSNGHLLAYVFTDEIFVNAEIIKHGFGKFAPHAVNKKYDDLFRMHENDAIEHQIGMWAR